MNPFESFPAVRKAFDAGREYLRLLEASTQGEGFPNAAKHAQATVAAFKKWKRLMKDAIRELDQEEA